MTEPVPPVPTGPFQDRPLDSPPAKQPQVGSTSGTLPFIQSSAGRWTAALVLVALAISYVAGAFWFRAAGYRKGYAAGFASVGYFEGAAIADSMKAVASDTVLVLAGLMPDSGQHGLWHVTRFGLKPAKALCKYGSERALDTMKVPIFLENERAPVGRSYRSGSYGRIYHVDR
jgi:hypothetical protein